MPDTRKIKVRGPEWLDEQSRRDLEARLRLDGYRIVGAALMDPPDHYEVIAESDC